MALFRSRSTGRVTENRRNPVGSAESVESMRRRARHRLIGAAVLVAAGVVGFPLLFDTQPRPVAKDVPIELPERDAARGGDASAMGGAPTVGITASPATSGSTVAAAPPAVRPSAALGGRDAVIATKPMPGGADAKKPDAVAQIESAPEPDPSADRARKSGAEAKTAAEKPVEKLSERVAEKSRPTERESTKTAAVVERPGPKPISRDELRIAKLEESARARALLQGKSEKEAAVAAASVGRRYVVQIGAFSEPERARSARAKAERAGVKTFMQETKIGTDTWTRVRVGPFATKAEADDAASKLKGVSLPASILTM